MIQIGLISAVPLGNWNNWGILDLSARKGRYFFTENIFIIGGKKCGKAKVVLILTEVSMRKYIKVLFIKYSEICKNYMETYYLLSLSLRIFCIQETAWGGWEKSNNLYSCEVSLAFSSPRHPPHWCQRLHFSPLIFTFFSVSGLPSFGGLESKLKRNKPMRSCGYLWITAQWAAPEAVPVCWAAGSTGRSSTAVLAQEGWLVARLQGMLLHFFHM